MLGRFIMLAHATSINWLSQQKPRNITLNTHVCVHMHTQTHEMHTIQRTMSTNWSISQDLSTSFHNRLVLALSVGVQFLWHGKIGMFLPYKNKCVECFSLDLHNVEKVSHRHCHIF